MYMNSDRSRPDPHATAALSASGGVNFAVAGSGVTWAPTLQDQVRWFSDYVEVGLFGPDRLKEAIAFVSVAGNDYKTYNGTSPEGYLRFVSEVVELMDKNLRRLYHLGIRNFMVSSVAPLACLPATTAATGYTSCPVIKTVDLVIASHNRKLWRAIHSLLTKLKGSNFIYLQQTRAMFHILKNPSHFGFSEGLRPCCTGDCGVKDFETCDELDKHFFWDSLHPTQAGWKAVVDLYYNHTGFTLFSPSLKAWIHNLGIYSSGRDER